MIARSWALPLLVLAGCGCSDGVFGDPFPIQIDTSSGPVIAHVREPGGDSLAAVIDVLSPLTRIVTDTDMARRCTDLTLIDASDVPRAHIGVTVTTGNPCSSGPCRAGPNAAPVPFAAVVGGDAFAPGAVRFDLAHDTLQLFSDVAGDAEARGRLCEAEFDDPFRGGGTLAFPGGTEVPFAARRIAIGACLSYEDRVPPAALSNRGADAELVVSTAIGTTILSRTAYQRWQAATGDTTDIDTLPAGSEWLVSGRVDGRLGMVDRLALVGRTDSERGPCTQVYAHHLLTAGDCTDAASCPCPGGDASCKVPSVLELEPTAGIPVLIVDDENKTLQALRTELRPATAEVDGILGTDALRATSFDVDAPDDRVLFRCEGPGCVARPELFTSDLRPLVTQCLARAVPDVDAGP